MKVDVISKFGYDLRVWWFPFNKSKSPKLEPEFEP